MRKAPSKKEYNDALLRRRIKFVVEKGAMARLFRKNTGSALQQRLFQVLKPAKLASLRKRSDYDAWLTRTVISNYWRSYSRLPLKLARWAYFAKLLNIVIYEIASNRELFSETNWKQIEPLLHIPIDSKVLAYIAKFDSRCPKIKPLKDMTRGRYLEIQNFARDLAHRLKIPPIWFEAAYSTRSSNRTT